MKKASKKSNELKQVIVDAILDKKGDSVLEIDLREIESSIADYFIVCSGNSPTQVSAIADSVKKEAKDLLGITPKGSEGKENATWIIVDYFDIVVHVFLKETREYYQLEELWSDALFVEHE